MRQVEAESEGVVPEGNTAAESVTLRFLPLGTEYRLSTREPAIGDIMKRDGDQWIVVDVRKDAQGNTVATLRPVHGPAI